MIEFPTWVVDNGIKEQLYALPFVLVIKSKLGDLSMRGIRYKRDKADQNTFASLFWRIILIIIIALPSSSRCLFKELGNPFDVLRANKIKEGNFVLKNLFNQSTTRKQKIVQSQIFQKDNIYIYAFIFLYIYIYLYLFFT